MKRICFNRWFTQAPIIFFLFCFSSRPGFSQRPGGENPWYFGAGASILVCDWFYEDEGPIQYLNEAYRPAPGLGLQLIFGREIRGNFSIESGVQFLSHGSTFREDSLVYNQPSPTEPNAVRFTHHDHFLEVPVKLCYSFGNGKWRFVASAGLIPSLYLSTLTTGKLWYPSSETERTRSFDFDAGRVFHLDPTLSLGTLLPFGKGRLIRIGALSRITALQGTFKSIAPGFTMRKVSGGLDFSYFF